MEAQPLSEVVTSRPWRLTVGGLLLGVAFTFHAGIIEMVRIWVNQSDYSHGFLVPFVAAFILWTRRDRLPPAVVWPDPVGLLAIAAGVALSVFAGVTNYAKELGQGVGLILALTGVVTFAVGRRGLRWAWPGLLYLLFMVKLPDRFEILFTFKLRQIATSGSNFLLQTLGFPSYVAGQQGTVITVGGLQLGVEWACSGLSMVLTFVAMAVAMTLLVKRPVADRVLVLASALPIAILSNVIRITLTALVYIAGWKWLGDVIVHDLAGWLMMPLALGFIAAELKLVNWLMVTPEAADRDGVLKSATRVAAASWQAKHREDDDTDPVPPPPRGAAR